MLQRILLSVASLILLSSLVAAQVKNPPNQNPPTSSPSTPAGEVKTAPETKSESKTAALLKQAQLYLDAKKVDQAEKSLLEALAAAPEKPPLQKEVAELFARVQTEGRKLKEADAREKADGAQRYLDMGDYENATKLSQDGLKLAPEGSQARKDCEDLLAKSLKGTRDLKKRKQLDSLKEANRLIRDGKLPEASKMIEKTFNEAEDQQVIDQARELWAKTHLSWVGYYWSAIVNDLAYLRWPIYAVIIIFVLYLLLRFLRFIYQWQQGSANILQLDEITDDSGLGLQDLIVDALYQYNMQTSPATAGLLRLEASPIPAAPTLKFQNEASTLGLALEVLPALGGTVKLEGLEKAVRQIMRWLKLTPPYLKGKVSKPNENKKILAFLNLNESSQIKVITASGDSNLEVARDLSASLAYKVLYLFYNRVSVPVAEAQDTLRQGMKLLGQYVSGIDPQKLDEAQKLFGQVLKERPELEEAHLYLGIALDLLERHDEAIRHFSYVKAHAQEKPLKHRAAYNEAIAHLRKFTPTAPDQAIDLLRPLLEEMLGDEELTASPIKALAYAAKADAIAHKPLFFIRIDGKVPLEELLQREDFPLVQWKEEVKQILKELGLVLQTVTCPPPGKAKWDELACRQLEWAMENARGDLYLNLVLCLRQLHERPELSELPHPNLERKLAGYLQQAEKAFRLCEILLPPGVETLSNLGTLFIQKKEFAEARSYLEQVISLNKDYEYAYYRLAQSYDKEERADKEAKVKEVMDRFKVFNKAPGIGGFKRLYEKYEVPLPGETT